jgi:hypothetical protein
MMDGNGGPGGPLAYSAPGATLPPGTPYAGAGPTVPTAPTGPNPMLSPVPVPSPSQMGPTSYQASYSPIQTAAYHTQAAPAYSSYSQYSQSGPGYWPSTLPYPTQMSAVPSYWYGN